MKSKIGGRRRTIKRVLRRMALVLAQTGGFGPLRSGGGFTLGLLVRVSARLTELSGRFRRVWEGIAVKHMPVALEDGGWQQGFRGPLTATTASGKVMARAWRMTRAPILISLC